AAALGRGGDLVGAVEGQGGEALPIAAALRGDDVARAQLDHEPVPVAVLHHPTDEAEAAGVVGELDVRSTLCVALIDRLHHQGVEGSGGDGEPAAPGDPRAARPYAVADALAEGPGGRALE